VKIRSRKTEPERKLSEKRKTVVQQVFYDSLKADGFAALYRLTMVVDDLFEMIPFVI